ncbi:hypothetical protein LguiB_005951 [Lonicera macranthoides]
MVGLRMDFSSTIVVQLDSQVKQLQLSCLRLGGIRTIVELFILQLQFLDDEGDKAELWELSRVYVNTLIEETTCEPSDRKPMEGEDEIIFMVVPDYQMFEYVERFASSLLDDLPMAGLSLGVLWEDLALGTRLCTAGRYRDINTRSGVPVLVVAGVEPPKADKGKGYLVQCGGNRLLGSKIQWLAKALGIFLIIAVLVELLILQLQFLDDEGDQAELWELSRVFVHTLIEETTCETFTTVYSMRPLPSGIVFRCYLGSADHGRCFDDDKDRQNIYSLAKELISHLDAEDPKKIFGGVEGNSKEGPSFFNQAASFFFSLNRFMKGTVGTNLITVNLIPHQTSRIYSIVHSDRDLNPQG